MVAKKNLLLISFLLLNTFVFAQVSFEEPKIFATSAILIDAQSGFVLYEKNADAIIAPASLTKLMTLHLVYKQLKAKKIKKTDLVPITNKAWALKLPRNTSRMFLEPGQRVSVLELMKGVAIVSGNDATIALAEYLEGSVKNFVAKMNEESKRLGFDTFYFEDTSGISPKNKITARQFAKFCQIYIQEHPQSLQELHSHTKMIYPLKENLNPLIKRRRNQILQHNNNTFLGRIKGVDGLKTGFISESGYNIALSASKNNMRVIAVILGVFNNNAKQGVRQRYADGKKLLSYAFDYHTVYKPTFPSFDSLKVYKGTKNTVKVALEGEGRVIVPIHEAKNVKSWIEIQKSLEAPIAKGRALGKMVFTLKGKELAVYPLKSQEYIPKSGFFKQLWHSFLLLFD